MEKTVSGAGRARSVAAWGYEFHLAGRLHLFECMSAQATLEYAESVGLHLLSLRQSVRDQHSLLTFERAHRSPITPGFAQKPPHCGSPAEA